MSNNYDNTKIDSTNLSAVWERIAELIQLITGNVDVINSGTLQEQINNMINGNTKVGDSEKLNGLTSDKFAPMEGSVYYNNSDSSVETDEFVPINANMLEGHKSEYFASKESVENIINGTTTVGKTNNAEKLGNLNPTAFARTDGSLAQQAVGKDGYIAYPEGGSYAKYIDNVVGKIRIKLPKYKNAVIKFKVNITSLVGSVNNIEYSISGRFDTYSVNSWIDCSAYSVSSNKNNLPVSFSHNDTDGVITIGNDDTIWRYPNIAITDVITSFDGGVNYDDWKSGWDISITSDNSDLTVSATVENPWIGNEVGNAETVNGVTIYKNIAEIDSTFNKETPIIDLVSKMASHSKLSTTIYNNLGTVYPVVHGVVTVDKTRDNSNYTLVTFSSRDNNRHWHGVVQPNGNYWSGWYDDTDAIFLGGETAAQWQEKLDNIQSTSKKDLSQAGWYRVLEYKRTHDGSIGTEAESCFLSIKELSGASETHLYRIDSVANKQTISPISIKSSGNGVNLSKIRYTYNQEYSYIEVYKRDSVPFYYTFSVFDGITGASCWKAIAPILTSETMEGVTVTCEYDIPANASPITDLDLVRYKGELLSTSILEKALELSTTVGVGVYEFYLNGDSYSGNDLPNSIYKYSSATVFVRNLNSITVVLWGTIGADDRAYPTTVNYYDGGDVPWTGWKTFATTDDIASAMESWTYADSDILYCSTDDEFRQIINDLHAYHADDTSYNAVIHVAYSGGSYLLGGTWKIVGHKTSSLYGYILAFKYGDDVYSGRINMISLINGTWTSMDKFISGKDLTTALAGYLPLSEGTVGNGVTSTPLTVKGHATYSGILYKDVNETLWGTLGFNSKDVPVFINGELSKTYSLLHTGNKPSGSYTGNGGAEARTIATGGIGSCCIIRSSKGIVVATPNGGFKAVSGGVTWLEGISFNNVIAGAIGMTTTDNSVNAAGAIYEYQVL